MNKTLKILFYLKKRANYVSGNVPIYLRLTIDGRRIEKSVQRECDPSKWDSKAGKASGNNKETRQLNNYLDTLHSQIYEAQRLLLNKGTEVTVRSIQNIIQGKKEHKKTLLEVYRYHVEQVKELVGKDYAVGTLKRFKAALSSLEAFLNHKYKEDLPINELSYQFITEYEFFLKSVRGIEHNTAMGIIKKLKQIIKICVANDWLEKDPFLSYRVKIRSTNRPFLLQEEVDKLVEKNFLSERLSQVRDIFIFCCYTGLAYADVQNLTNTDIVTGIDGEKWIHTERVKTETSTRLPILPPAMEIIERYKDHPHCIIGGKLLPVLSNQKMNEYLKEIAVICDVNKKMTFHTSRHTFATTITLTNGIPIETVSKMLGHKSIRTTQQYAKILDKKVSEDMGVLRGKTKRR